MARKKKKVDVNVEERIDPKNVTELIEQVLDEKFGDYIDPEMLIVKTGVRPLDAVLGGGLVLGMPVMVTGAAEIGKTTLAWQLIKSLLDQYENAIATYIDVEGSANSSNEELGIRSRLELMHIDRGRVIYKSMTLTIEKTFELIETTINKKRDLEEKLSIKIPMIIVWDSIADTEPEKIEDILDPNKMIGYKARLIQFYLGKYKPLFRRNQVMLFLIDQVRSNITDNMNIYQKQEKQIGQVNNLRSATGAKSVEHKLRQWLFLSKGSDIYDKDNVLGWYLDIHILKSKLAPSGYILRTVFDKRYGIDKFWTEYHFISNLTPFEEIVYKKLGGANSSRAKEYKQHIENILGVQTAGAYKQLQYIDPQTGEVILSKKFYEKDARKLYYSNSEFKEFFDKIVDYHVNERIIKLFNSGEFSELLDNDLNPQVEQDETTSEIQ